jgi:two-component system, OmpR family, KDP operon response regulator KdpE
LRSQGFEVEEAATGRQGLERLALAGADLVVLDLGLPDIDGHQVLAELRQWSRVPVIVLSVRSSEVEKVRALDAGANDYVTKPFGIQEFMARVRSLLRASHRVIEAEGSEAPFDDGHLRIDRTRRMVALEGAPVHLTPKEYAVLATLVSHAGRVVTQQQLLREHWGPAHVDDTHYLRIVVAKLRQKLGDDATRPKYLATEPGVGYRFSEE